MRIETLLVAEGLRPPPMPWTPLLVLSLVFAISLMMFVALTRRWTSHRLWIALQDWARANDFVLHRRDQPQLPPPLIAIAELQPTARWILTGPRTWLVQLVAKADAKGAEHWNVLVRELNQPRATAGLRPAKQRGSLIDFFALNTFPSLAGQERFRVCAADLLEARRLNRSHAPALLPPDIGLLLKDQFLLLDFSSRPFDPIELGRIIALADQLQSTL